MFVPVTVDKSGPKRRPQRKATPSQDRQELTASRVTDLAAFNRCSIDASLIEISERVPVAEKSLVVQAGGGPQHDRRIRRVFGLRSRPDSGRPSRPRCYRAGRTLDRAAEAIGRLPKRHLLDELHKCQHVATYGASVATPALAPRIDIQIRSAAVGM
jgi:hypothetical protein